MKQHYTISRYIISRLKEAGVNHLFGVPGDYVLDFLDEVIASPVEWVGTCNELNAGYAADGYARMNGIAAAAVTYGVGGLSILNAAAGAYAEQVPMIIISGAPPTKRRLSGALVHHLVANYQMQCDIFHKITADAAILTDAETAPEIIDRVIGRCFSRKLPVYLELPADIALAECNPPRAALKTERITSDTNSLAESAEEAAEMINAADHPIILAGAELMRQGLGKTALRLVEKVELPFATMLSSKSLLPEFHPQFAGIYQGGWSREITRRQVEESDCLISLGVQMTDLDTGLFSVHMDERRTISAGADRVRIGWHHFDNVHLSDFLDALMPKLTERTYSSSHPAEVYRPKTAFTAEASRKLTAPRLYECIDSFLDDNMVLLAEPGDAFCAAPEFHIEEAENFIVQPYYAAIGYCTPAALGVALARPAKRPVVLTGDGALQMTAQEISTLIRQKSSAVIIVVNNDGYLIERALHEDGPYNDIQPWRYDKLPYVFCKGDEAIGIRAETEEELVATLETARRNPDKVVVIDACLPDRDCSSGLDRLGRAFRGQ